MDKSWIALPRHLQPALRQAGGRVIFFDLGAGTNAGADNGASLTWFTRAFDDIGSPIEHIIAWEAAVVPPRSFWDTIRCEPPWGRSAISSSARRQPYHGLQTSALLFDAGWGVITGYACGV